MTKTVIHWFRKGLRLHDNPALCDAITVATDKTYILRPIFILDPLIVTWMKIGPNRWRFLQQSLTDLNNQLQTLGSRLYVVRGKPEEVFPKVFKEWQVTLLTFELDIEPFSIERDRIVEKIAKQFHVEIKQCVSHTIYNTELILAKNLGKPPLTYQKFLSVAESLGKVKEPLPAPLAIPDFCLSSNEDESYDVPSLKELGVDELQLGDCKYPGGETEALKRLNRYMKQQKWVCNFEKPNTSPNSLEPSTTVLSPYLKFGCLSSKLFYQRLKQVTNNTKHSKPPVSLLGQLLWREFYYACASAIPNFDKMSGNTICCQIPWGTNESHLTAWKNGQTGYPFIDAIMRQLKQEGWIHHLARHAVACFLTRGDLWISWEEGQKVFEEYLLDADWALNAGNWMWLSASAFFHQFFRVYSPVAFGKKTDKTGEYIRKYVPEIKKFSPEYIYEPWNAPLSVQQTAGCIVGKDYPKRIVVHEDVYKVNIGKMTAAYKENKAMKAEVSASKRLQSEEPKPKEGNKKAKKDPQKGNKKGNEKGKKDSQTGSIIKFLKK